MPEIRGTAFSVFTLTDDIGKGLGPGIIILIFQFHNFNSKYYLALVVLMIQDFHGDRR
jgi:hypothetical protein